MKSLKIKISFIDKETSVEHGSELEVPMTTSQSLSIDKSEQLLVDTAYRVMRESLSNHLEAMSKKKRSLEAKPFNIHLILESRV